MRRWYTRPSPHHKRPYQTTPNLLHYSLKLRARRIRVLDARRLPFYAATITISIARTNVSISNGFCNTLVL